jgi:ubiquinol-cytochrome c reductase cytochrome b subunit
MLTKIAMWFEERLHIRKLFEATAGHKVPRSTNSWFYVFGSATLTCFAIQVITGICLAFVYVPSADQAYTSLNYLNHEQFLGWFLRAVHNWGSNFMVAMMTLHLVQTFLFGAYKFPRELTWLSGCVLFLCTLGMAFTGQVLRFDGDSYWGLGIGASITGRSPGIGAMAVRALLAGPIIAGETLSRFFTLHVFFIPGIIIALVSMHLRLVITKGVNEFPVPGKLVKRESYVQEYEAEVHKSGVPFVPHVIGKDLVFSGVLMLAILATALICGPAGPGSPPDPTLIHTTPRPDFFFLAVFAITALLPAYMETFVLLIAPVIMIGVLFAVPFLAGTGEKSFRRRPIAVLIVFAAFLTLCTLAYLGTQSPWSPKMEAWSSMPTPSQYLKGRTPLQLQGALVVQSRQCRNCHALGGEGGRRGPELDGVATRLTHDQLIRQVIQGGGNMPAYGKNLGPAEVAALVAFMDTLRPDFQPPATDFSRQASNATPSNTTAASVK